MDMTFETFTEILLAMLFLIALWGMWPDIKAFPGELWGELKTGWAEMHQPQPNAPTYELLEGATAELPFSSWFN